MVASGLPAVNHPAGPGPLRGLGQVGVLGWRTCCWEPLLGSACERQEGQLSAQAKERGKEAMFSGQRFSQLWAGLRTWWPISAFHAGLQ